MGNVKLGIFLRKMTKTKGNVKFYKLPIWRKDVILARGELV